MTAWKSLSESYPQLGEAKKPTFLMGVRKRELSEGYWLLAGFGALVLVISVLALLADDLAIGTTWQPWVSAGVGGAALLVSGLEYLGSDMPTLS